MTVQEEASWYEVISAWGSVFGTLFALGALVVPLILWWHDRRTHLSITYSIGEPKHPTDLNDIPSDQRPRVPALYIKVLNKSKMDVRLNNVFIKIPAGSIIFESIGNISTRLERRTAGDHWLFYQPMHELANTLKEHGYSGVTSFDLVVRDGAGTEHSSMDAHFAENCCGDIRGLPSEIAPGDTLTRRSDLYRRPPLRKTCRVFYSSHTSVVR